MWEVLKERTFEINPLDQDSIPLMWQNSMQMNRRRRVMEMNLETRSQGIERRDMMGTKISFMRTKLLLRMPSITIHLEEGEVELLFETSLAI